MDHDAKPNVAYVIAQTGPGSAFSAGSPTSDPALTRAPGAKEPPNGPKVKQPAAKAPAAPSEPAEPNADDPAADKITPPPAPVGRPALEYPTYAATDYRPRGIVEKDLCQRASSPDWVYMIGSFGLASAAVMFDSSVGQQWKSPAARVTSSSFIGLTWGGFLSGAYLSLPKCSPDFVPPVSPEGSVTTRWPLAIAVSVVAGVSAPFLVYIETGYVPSEWKFSERGARIYIPAIGGVIGALLPWIPAIGPKTYRNALKLERLRIDGAPVPPGATRAPNGAMVGYSFTF